jgi:hypothetical protein
MTRSGVVELFERISRLVPGISGYQDREKCRATDKAVRVKAADTVAGARNGFSRVMADLSRAGGTMNLRIIGDMERIIARLERLEDEIRFASYGFAGWFDHSGVVLEDLERVYEHDLGLLEQAAALKELVPASLGGDGAWVRDLGEAVDALSVKVSERGKALEGG